MNEINPQSEPQGLRLRERTILEATIIEGSFTTKNQAGELDPKCIRRRRGTSGPPGLRSTQA